MPSPDRPCRAVETRRYETNLPSAILPSDNYVTIDPRWLGCNRFPERRNKCYSDVSSLACRVPRVTHVEQAERDAHGRWRRGSGNPAGRPRGAKNRHPRRRAGDRERVAEWTEHDWRVFYQRTFQEAEGEPSE